MSHLALLAAHHEHVREVICHPRPCAHHVVEVVKIIVIEPRAHFAQHLDRCHDWARHCHEAARHCWEPCKQLFTFERA